jgi:transcriptional regulator with XRE-family HTH domain
MPGTRHQAILKTFGARLKAARANAGHSSAQQFAYLLGIEPATYRKYERGAAEPNFETLTRICEHLSIAPDYLLPIAAKAGKKQTAQT